MMAEKETETTETLTLTEPNAILAAVEELESGDTLTYRTPGKDRAKDLDVDGVETGEEWTGHEDGRVVFLNGPRGGSYRLQNTFPARDGNDSLILELRVTGRANESVQDLADRISPEGDTLTGREVRVSHIPDDVQFHEQDWNYAYTGDGADAVTLFITTEQAPIHIAASEDEFSEGALIYCDPDHATDVKALDYNRANYRPGEDENGNFVWRVDSTALAYIVEELTLAGHTVSLGQDAARRAGHYKFSQGRYGLPALDEDGRFPVPEDL